MLDVFLTPFKGFAARDFDAYTQEKWSSNLHTRARTEVRDKLIAIGRFVEPRLQGAGLQLSWATNEPVPNVFNSRCVDAQWLSFARTEELQRELSTIIDREKSIAENLRDPAHHKRHLMFALRIDQRGARLALAAHRNAVVDVRNGARKLEDTWEINRLDQLLLDVNARCADLGLFTAEGLVAVGEARATQVATQLRQMQAGQEEWFWIGRDLPADDPALSAESFRDTVAEVFSALAPLYTFLRWARDNDWVHLREQLEKKKELNKREGVELEAGDAVLVTSGLFVGKQGVIQDFDKKGVARVAIGKLVVQIKGTALKRVEG